MAFDLYGPPLTKAPKGTFLRERKAQRAAELAHEEREKTKVRKRDQVCRWPWCDCRKWKLRLECAHLVNKSQGGRSNADAMILLCFEKHQGRPSLHSGDLMVDPLTAKGTNGPCAFYRKDETGQWLHIASEKRIGVPEARR